MIENKVCNSSLISITVNNSVDVCSPNPNLNERDMGIYGIAVLSLFSSVVSVI